MTSKSSESGNEFARPIERTQRVPIKQRMKGEVVDKSDRLISAIDNGNRFGAEGVDPLLSIPDASLASFHAGDYMAMYMTIWVVLALLHAAEVDDYIKKGLREVPERVKAIQERHGETFDERLGRIGETARHLSL